MQLFNNGIALDTSKEHEIMVGGLGMDVTHIDVHGHTTIMHNITEVHFMYPDGDSDFFGHGCAFESDVHSGGCIKRLKDTLVISISPSSRVYDYWG